jgi:hypothetical protein
MTPSFPRWILLFTSSCYACTSSSGTNDDHASGNTTPLSSSNSATPAQPSTDIVSNLTELESSGGPELGSSASVAPTAPAQPGEPTEVFTSDATSPTTTGVEPGTSDTSEGEASTSEPEDEGPSTSAGRLRPVPIGSTDATLGFWEYLPPNYDAGPAPLLVFTHGASWQGPGTEESLQELLEVGPPNLIHRDQWPDSRPFVVLSPQNPRSGCFDANDIRDFYEYALATYDIDPARIYHTGQSCGAIGGWNYLAAHGDEHVVAAVLISGDGRDAFASAGCDLGRVAIWGLHNENDGSVPSIGTIEPIESLMNCEPKPDVKLTVYPGETAHDAWTKTYDSSAGNDIYSWLLAHRRP